MKKLNELLTGLEYELKYGDENVEISSLVYDSRKVEKGSVFICIKGANFDGHDAAQSAAESGAAAIVSEKDIPGLEGRGCTLVITKDTRYALANLSAAWFDHPADRIKTIGITGTKGKTTTTYLVKSALEHMGKKVGLIGTIEIVIGDEHIPAKNTTPESYELQNYFKKMADAGLDTVVMEVSSQALMQHRTAGFVFDIGVFTNLSPDHIGDNEHKDFDDYLECKSMLFKQCKVGIANGDDEYFERVMKNHTCTLETYGIGEKCDLIATDINLDKEPGHLGVSFNTEGLMQLRAKVPSPGRFSVYNALCAAAICRHFGASGQDIESALSHAHVKGRIEKVKVSDDFTLLIDYAHNAMALESLLTALKEYEPERLVCLFGCGGNRARSRRFEMGEVSGRLADFTIITSDNPRFEEPLDIIADIVTGISKTDGKFIEIPDRKEAIRYAIKNGKRGDIIVLAGKGHEDYQEIKGVKYPMDERVLIKEILEEENIKV